MKASDGSVLYRVCIKRKGGSEPAHAPELIYPWNKYYPYVDVYPWDFVWNSNYNLMKNVNLTEEHFIIKKNFGSTFVNAPNRAFADHMLTTRYNNWMQPPNVSKIRRFGGKAPKRG